MKQQRFWPAAAGAFAFGPNAGSLRRNPLRFRETVDHSLMQLLSAGKTSCPAAVHAFAHAMQPLDYRLIALESVPFPPPLPLFMCIKFSLI